MDRGLSEPLQRHGVADRGEAQNAALLGGLDDIGAHALAIDAGDLREARQHRLQPDAPISTAFCTM